MAQRFAGAGWVIVVTDRDPGRAARIARELPGDGHQAMNLDVTREADWAEVDEQIVSRHGRLDLLVNNAGVATGGRAEETPLADWLWVMDINLMGVVNGCHRFIPMLRRQGFGHIVNVASWAGLAGAPQIAAYGTAKAAVVAFSEMLRAELAGAGVQVSVLCPAFVKTRLHETMRAPDADYARRVQRWMEHSGVSAEDVAEQVFRAVEKPRFLILTHSNTRWHWWFKRWFPELYFRLLRRAMGKLERA